MLYTTYFSKLSELPSKDVKVIITRFLPKGFDLKKYPNTFWMPQLSPSKELLKRYKDDNDWNYFVGEFKDEMWEWEYMVDMLARLGRFLSEGKDVYLVYYEKDCTKCHRSLIADYLYLTERNMSWREFNGR